MSNPLHAKCYADQACSQIVSIVERRELAHETFLVRFCCPEIAVRILPGQFVMVRLPGSAEPILGRAFALYDVVLNPDGNPECVDFVFHVVGKLTSILAKANPGDKLQVWGPLGNGFPDRSVDHVIMVAGGIGQTPFLAVAKELTGQYSFGRKTSANRVTLCYGARSAKYLAGIDDFKRLGVDVHVSTDDGTQGHHGRVTDLLQELLQRSEVQTETKRVICCGPEKMMAATSDVCFSNQVDCEVSLETPMACGIGICFSCVAKVKQDDGSWDFKRTCVDGPVFDARQLIWT